MISLVNFTLEIYLLVEINLPGPTSKGFNSGELDRILASGSWEENFPTCFAWAQARIGSDHCPLVLDTREQGASRPRHFFFEIQWFQQEGFKPLVEKNGEIFKLKLVLIPIPWIDGMGFFFC